MEFSEIPLERSNRVLNALNELETNKQPVDPCGSAAFADFRRAGALGNAVVAIQFSNSFSQESFEAYLATLCKLCAESNSTFALVMDLREMGMPPSPWYFARQIFFLREYTCNMQRCIEWTVLITGSPILDNLLHLLFTIVPPQKELYIFRAVA